MQLLIIAFILDSVQVESCQHLLGKANYNAIQKLAVILDVDQAGGSAKGIMHLMRSMLNDIDFIRIWRGACGGESSAMGLMHYLSVTKCTKVNEFLVYVTGAGHQKAEAVIKGIMKDNDIEGHEILNEIKHEHLNTIAACLSDDPDASNQGLQINWKNVASEAGITDVIEIVALKADMAAKNSSLTMQFIRFVNVTFPQLTIAKFARHLLHLQINSAVQDSEIFKDCWREKCIVSGQRECGNKTAGPNKDIPNITKEIQDEYDGKLC